ncbi:hypothetical protein ACHAWO_011653 [Cyclotella atomus]|uniref:Uncharacterized protein n=1 Tax=Cyclotella atomus TaxID=382360 RepID=A0ABD3NT57_9STRA
MVHEMVMLDFSNKSGLDNSPFGLMEDLQWKHQISNVLMDSTMTLCFHWSNALANYGHLQHNSNSRDIF